VGAASAGRSRGRFRGSQGMQVRRRCGCGGHLPLWPSAGGRVLTNAAPSPATGFARRPGRR
jgi:DNA-binding IclR family transcriptional regulator